MSVLGGREIHPINVRVGGFYRVPREARTRRRSREALKRARDIGAGDGALGRRIRLSRLRARLRVRRAAASPTNIRSTRAASSRTAGSTSPPRIRRAFRGEACRALERAAFAYAREAARISSGRSPATA